MVILLTIALVLGAVLHGTKVFYVNLFKGEEYSPTKPFHHLHSLLNIGGFTSLTKTQSQGRNLVIICLSLNGKEYFGGKSLAFYPILL